MFGLTVAPSNLTGSRWRDRAVTKKGLLLMYYIESILVPRDLACVARGVYLYWFLPLEEAEWSSCWPCECGGMSVWKVPGRGNLGSGRKSRSLIHDLLFKLICLKGSPQCRIVLKFEDPYVALGFGVASGR
jgi:hypothetical protein